MSVMTADADLFRVDMTGFNEDYLSALLAVGQQRARLRRRAILVSVILRVPGVDPLTFFESGAGMEESASFWSTPGRTIAMAGVGVAHMLQASGPGRYEQVNSAWQALQMDAVIDSPAGTVPRGAGPVLLGGFSFDPRRVATAAWEGYPDGLLVLPRFLLTCVHGVAWLTINTLVRPDDGVSDSQDSVSQDSARILAQVNALLEGGTEERGNRADLTGLSRPPVLDPEFDIMSESEWEQIVDAALRRIDHGDFEKVVLARAFRVQGDRPFAPTSIVRRLRDAYTNCFIFAMVHGERCFLGASPERLVRVEDGLVAATCLAGSAPRGATAEQDEVLGNTLLASMKDRAEHAVVVSALCASLAEVCHEVTAPDRPTLMKMANVQHLYTPVQARIEDGMGILDVVASLHPTPAMGGYPREAALAFIREHEGLDRGWYAAPVGWLDGRGAGEFAVAIRSALLHGAQASLFAGCGIVAGSDPLSEYAESELKLRPLLDALGESAS